MHTYYRLFTSFIKAHRAVSAAATIILLGGIWYYHNASSATSGKPRYMIGVVTRGTIISSISGSGQVTADQQLDIKPKVSGQITSLRVIPGQKVSEGTLIAVIDATDAQKTVRDAQANLTSAQLALTKLQQPATTVTLTQQQNALSQSQQSLDTQYQSNFSDITSTFLDLPAIIASLQDINLGNSASDQNLQSNIDYFQDQAKVYSPLAIEYRNAAYNDFVAARKSYDQTFLDFKSLTATPDKKTIEKMSIETRDTTGLLATAAKSSYDLLQFYSDQLTQHNHTPKTIATTYITNLNTYQTKLQSHLTTLLADQNSIASNKNSIQEKSQTIDQTNQGANTIDLQSAQLSIVQKQNALQDAQNALANYFIRAPFNGTVASVAAHTYDQANSGTTIATVVTPLQLADLSLNEVDAAKIKIGNKAILTFDALPTLTLTGSVAQINPLGTVTQGVVSYDVKISFDAQNSEIKSGMTVNASIQTGERKNVLVVPQSAVKTQNGQKYILAFVPSLPSSTLMFTGSGGVGSNNPPVHVPVETGLPDDSNVEIISGLTEDEQIVVRTITATTPQTTTSGGTTSKNSGTFGGGARLP